MLTLSFEIDREKVANAYSLLGISGEAEGANVLFYDEEDVAGLFRMRFDGGEVLIDKIIFKDSVELGDRDFFVRATFFKLSNRAPVVVKIKGYHKELETFGFVYGDDCMSVLSSNITLCGGCAGKKD